jgi:hypothetical protein
MSASGFTLTTMVFKNRFPKIAAQTGDFNAAYAKKAARRLIKTPLRYEQGAGIEHAADRICPVRCSQKRVTLVPSEEFKVVIVHEEQAFMVSFYNLRETNKKQLTP